MTCADIITFVLEHSGWFTAAAVFAPFVSAGMIAAWYEMRFKSALRQEREFEVGLYRTRREL